MGGGGDAAEGVVVERDEVEDEQGGGENAVAGEAEFLMFESTVNQFLLAAPMKPEVLGKDAWQVAVASPSKMSAAHRDCVLSANTNLAKAFKMGKRVYDKARDDHVSFLKIIKQGAAVLTGARKEKAKAEADLKKSQAAAAAAPDCGILKIKKAHTKEEAQELTKTKEKNKKTIDRSRHLRTPDHKQSRSQRSCSHSPRGRSQRSRSRNRSFCCHSPCTPSLGGRFQSPQPPAILNGILDPEPPACPEALNRLKEGGLLFSNV
jgi:hypothetical protein